MASTLLGFPTPKLQRFLHLPSRLPPPSDAGDILGCLLVMESRVRGGVSTPLLSPAPPSRAAGRLLDPSLPDADHMVLHRCRLPGPIML